jgi:hypothetical protein
MHIPTNRRIAVAVLGIAMAAAPGMASAQINPDLDPVYGTITAGANLEGAPRSVHLAAIGGTEAAAQSMANCSGFTTSAPSYRLIYTPGANVLSFTTQATADATLLVRAPDGSWHCDDNGHDGRNASVAFAEPQPGRYDVWVGHAVPNMSATGISWINETTPPGGPMIRRVPNLSIPRAPREAIPRRRPGPQQTIPQPN